MVTLAKNIGSIRLSCMVNNASNDNPLSLETTSEGAIPQALELLTRTLDGVINDLRTWYSLRDTDSFQAAQWRNEMYGRLCDDIEERLLPQAEAVGCKVIVIAGDTGVETVRMAKNAYSFINVSNSKPLASGEAFDLIRFTKLNDHIARTATVYVGGWGRKIEIAGLAKAVSEGAELSLVQLEEIDQVKSPAAQ